VAIDLASERMGPALTSAGFDGRAEATWVWEGVVPYLTAVDVRDGRHFG
jgi:O-methyltransferase involved in polyketide biosynthesis